MELKQDQNNNNNITSDFSNELNIFLENHHEGDLFTIDRIENETAICENRTTRQMVNIHLSKLPENIKENDIIKYTNGEYILETEEAKTLKEDIRSKFDSLRKK